MREYRGNLDAYTGAMIQQSYQLDHVCELHVVRDAFVAIRQRFGDVVLLNDVLIKSIVKAVNQKENLNLTTAFINHIKFIAFRNFQQDYHRGPITLLITLQIIMFTRRTVLLTTLSTRNTNKRKTVSDYQRMCVSRLWKIP